tara:strand:- start:342 stop:473 length:132 start_codon:yes stop_codon:yes gene_type:complete
MKINMTKEEFLLYVELKAKLKKCKEPDQALEAARAKFAKRRSS